MDEKIEYKTLANILCVNEYSLHRIFYFVTNISLVDYIRKRRLSSSCIDLLNGRKIIDVATKYQYESPTSFGRAFKKMMGFKPKDIALNKNLLKIYPIFNFDKSIDINDEKELSYAKLDNVTFNLYSINKKIDINNISTIAPLFWNKALSNKDFIFKDKRYGIVKYDKNLYDSQTAIYHIASTINFRKSKNIKIENKSFLRFTIKSRNAIEISKFTNLIYVCYIPYSNYNLDNVPDIEEYIGKDITNIYIPIVLKNANEFPF